MKLELGRSWEKKLAGRIKSFEFEVGILDDTPHRDPVVAGMFEDPQLGFYAGGPVRRASRKAGSVMNSEVLIQNMERLNINLLLRPFQETSSEIMKFTRAFLMLVCKKPGMSIRRVENLLQAIVRNPILKQEYGTNASHTADAKGFDRHLIDTGQMFKSIKAKANRV